MQKIYLQWSKILFLLLLTTGLAFAQSTTVKGKVTDARTGDGVIGANIIVKGTATGTITDSNGEFSLEVPANATLLVSFIGYISEEVAVTGDRVDVQLSEDITSLEEVVISGLASTVKRSNLGNTVSSVSGEELAGRTAIQTLDGGLQGKVVGAQILSNSGAPGGGISMKLRGITTITGSSEPLYIIDGVYVDNSVNQPATNTVTQAQVGGGPTSNQDNGANRIGDLDPNDIANIEILKGASASAIYGSRANAGVVIITTKRGATGKTSVTFGQDVGVAKILNPLGVRPFTSQSVLADFGPAAQAQYDAAKAAGKLYNYEDEMYGETGTLLNTRLTVSGGGDKTKFYLAASNKDEEGIIKNTGFKRQSVRANIDHKISDMFDFNMSTNYIRSQMDRGVTNNDNAGVSYGVALSATLPWHELHPTDGIYPNHPANPSNPLQTRDKSQIGDVTNRFIVGSGLNVNILRKSNSLLQLKLTGGLDYYNNESTLYFPEYLQFTINNQDGLYSRGNNVTFNTNASAFLIFSTTAGTVDLTTSAGINRLDQHRELLTTQAQQLVAGQANLNQAGALNVFNRVLDTEDIGYAFQQEANWQDKLIGTASVRLDKSSLNGDPNKLFAYPKFSLAANIANFDFWPVDAISQLKLRTAYGEAGGVPNPNPTTLAQAVFTPLAATNTGGETGTIVGNVKGDPDILPERSKEFEIGMDLGVFNNRVGLEATWYNKKVEDLILQAAMPPSSGFTAITTNLADIENKGVELSLTALVVSKSAVKWNTTLNWWKNVSELTRLDIPAFNPPGAGFGTGLGTVRLEEGKSLTQIVGTNGSTTVEVLGNTAPDWELSWNNSVTFLKNFEFSMLWHWKKGGNNINLTGLLTDFGGTSYNYDKILPDGQRLGDARIAAFFSGQNASLYVEDSEYIKLREISLYYSLPKSVLSSVFKDAVQRVRFGVSGNNLLLISDYSSYDPEVSNFGSGGVIGGVEVTPFPNSKRMFFHLEVAF
ncbi:MAG TPA: SusC/RagA family TonB-linked outer membrane protein [Cyclobacteriaceae bacterium]|nr:SusC/RagA family TonB-linked outer membrane protein [Cyclobacteriaceae bacterium]